MSLEPAPETSQTIKKNQSIFYIKYASQVFEKRGTYGGNEIRLHMLTLKSSKHMKHIFAPCLKESTLATKNGAKLVRNLKLRLLIAK